MGGLAHLSVLIVQPGHLAVVLAVGVLKVACELLVSPSLLFELFARGCLGTSAVYGLDAKGGYLGDARGARGPGAPDSLPPLATRPAGAVRSATYPGDHRSRRRAAPGFSLRGMPTTRRQNPLRRARASAGAPWPRVALPASAPEASASAPSHACEAQRPRGSPGLRSAVDWEAANLRVSVQSQTTRRRCAATRRSPGTDACGLPLCLNGGCEEWRCEESRPHLAYV
eukprot:scaffold744_cov111-Isochrysis_galbana.AAC.12